jgi:formate dehydrogenase iron-sulfur subunit
MKSFFIDLSRCIGCRGCQVACKQWHKLPAEKTANWGSYQNPPDLTFNTYKLVRFEEQVINGKLEWLFFPEQCRHCIDAPCKMVGDMYDSKAIIRDESTGAIIYTERTKNLPFEEIKGACPYNIPRLNPKTKVISKCDMCLDRVENGMLPACVKACPTGAMNFGEREDMLKLADARLKEVKADYPQAGLVDKDFVKVIYLSRFEPKLYYEYMYAENRPRNLMNRQQMLARMFRPFKEVIDSA